MEPVNFSEVIAQIDIEMQLRGWTTVQGREYLKKTYGKRSRTLLTEVELLDFLQYLESLPTPTLDQVLIAKINVEMQRLGWTTQQRQEYLKKSYGKRSRFLLTDDESHEFFQYLTSQPTPPFDEVLIAKINVEIERLYWTKKQEEQYFITTYSKPDRTLLTQEELLDFLRYLESHPIPEDDSELYAEYEEFQDFSSDSEESDNIITKMYPVHLLYPVHLFEVLTKTDVEMQRLGWTTDQGREHLIKTYGKRGRSLLTDEELYEFLQYLTSQPTPSLDELPIAKINVEIKRLWWTEEQEQEYLIKSYGKQNTNLLTQEELLEFLRYLESHEVEYSNDLEPEYEEFQDFFRYPEESDKVITRMSSDDLSKVLAKTDVEMERLGLTSEQGREHLIKTYGKRSRFLLTDEELQEFLQYLQSQPDPIVGF